MSAKVLAYAPPPLRAPRLASFSRRYWTFYRVEREEWKVKAEPGNKAAAGNSRSAYRYPWKWSIEAKVSPITKGICLRGSNPRFESYERRLGKRDSFKYGAGRNNEKNREKRFFDVTYRVIFTMEKYMINK